MSHKTTSVMWTATTPSFRCVSPRVACNLVCHAVAHARAAAARDTQMLDRDLEEAEEQIQVTMRAHLKAIDVLIDTQDARLLALEASFSEAHRSMRAEFAAEAATIRARVARDRKEMSDIVETVATEEARDTGEVKQVRAHWRREGARDERVRAR